MRRKDREVKDFEEMVQIMKKCDVCRLAFSDKDVPYILPLNFGITVQGEKVVLYFHGASQGKKYELLARNNRVSFEMDCSHRLVSEEDAGHCTMEFESVIGTGYLEIVPEEEKEEALIILTDRYHEKHFSFDRKGMTHTTAMKLVIEKMTGKRRMKG